MESHLETLCQHLRHDIDLRVVVFNDHRNSSSDHVDGISVERVGTWATIASSGIAPSLLAAIRRHRDAAIVHLHWPNPFGLLAYLASGHPGKLVITYHSDVIKQQFLGRLYQPVLDLAIRRASAVIATSPDYIRHSPVLSRFPWQCRVVPLGIEPDQFDRPDVREVQTIRARYGPNILLGIGRLVYYKGFEYAIRAMRDIDGRLLIIGEGPLRARLEALASECGVADKVTLLGRVENTLPYLHAAEIFVFPSIARSEAFGIAQLEAMICGKPVINTSIDSGVPFVSVDRQTGFTVAPRDPEALAWSAQLLLADPELRARFGNAARRRALGEFSAEVMARRTHDLYRSVLGVEPRAVPARRGAVA